MLKLLNALITIFAALAFVFAGSFFAALFEVLSPSLAYPSSVMFAIFATAGVWFYVIASFVRGN